MRHPLHYVTSVMQKLRTLGRETLDMGLVPASALLCDRISARWQPKGGPIEILSLRHRDLPHPLCIRRHTSDSFVLRTVLSEREYAGFNPPDEPKLIVDCGANIGCASAYFLARFPKAHVVAIEPDDGNVKLCRENLLPYGARATVMQAAIWPEEIGLDMVRGQFRDGRDWAHQVRPAEIGRGAEVRGITIDSLLKQLPFERINMLKIDIEGAEKQLLAGDCRSWLARVDNLFIELHDPEAEQIFQNAMRHFTYQATMCGELSTCLGIVERA